MKNYINHPLRLAAICSVLLCAQAFAEAGDIVARIGDKEISVAQYEARAIELRKSGYAHIKELDLASKRELLDGIIARELLVMEGLRRGLERDSVVADAIDKTRRRLIIKALYEREAVQPAYSFSEEQLRQFFVERNYNYEVLAQHIVCKSEDEARKVIAELNKGVPFASLVSAHSIRQIRDRFGPNGWVGWFKIGEVYEGLKEPLSTMEPGQLYPEPVLTPVGYHVFRLKARRPVDLDSAREWVEQQLRVQLRADDMERYIGKLRSRYDLVISPQYFPALLKVDQEKMSWSGKDRKLAAWRGGKLAARDYMREVAAGRAVHPALLDSAELYKAVDNLAGRQIMMAEAAALGISENAEIRSEVEAERDVLLVKMLYRAESKDRAREFSEEDVRSFYDQNIGEFTRADGKVTEFSFIHNSIHSMLRERALSASMDSFIAELRETYKDQIDVFPETLDLAFKKE